MWDLTLDAPFESSYVSIVYPAMRRDGARAVLKLQFPHHESDHEHEALRRWNGNGAVQLLEYDPEHHALLLERCEPGRPLSSVDADQALRVFSALLPRLWVSADEPFTTLSAEAAAWIDQLPVSWERGGRPFDVALLDLALASLDRLRSTQGEQALLHQDLHAENVLSATREPWLVIDPKPLVGEREFAIAPIVRGFELGHGREQVVRRLDTLTTSLGLDRERARLWALAQTLAWGCEGEHVSRHVETARWLSEA
jgi:streptomycin 6-kinase